jgi:class 3 adenylate cyclase
MVGSIRSLRRVRIVKRTGDGSIIEFRSVVDIVNCAIEVQKAMVERNAGVTLDKRIEFRIGIHLGDVVEETDGDLMGDGVNIAARLEGICEPGGVCLSEDAYRQVRDRLKENFADLGEKPLKNIARPVKVFGLSLSAIRRGEDGHCNTCARADGEWTVAAMGSTRCRAGARACGGGWLRLACGLRAALHGRIR